ncbi:MAG: hypothetical protein LBK47_03110 [Prevotellaceae bacterium]|jgi:hypothetical protein|nr:hypothetical protein [Prevotellaceae bacterium]
MITFYLISLAAFLIYHLVVIGKFGVPKSVSETFYLWGKPGQAIVTLWSWIVAIPLMIFGSGISPENAVFSIFFCGVFLVGVFTAAPFKYDFIAKYHFAFAGICAGLAFLWIFLVIPSMWWIIPTLAVPFLILGFLIPGNTAEGKSKNSVTFWLEEVAFVSLYVSMFLYYLQCC